MAIYAYYKPYDIEDKVIKVGDVIVERVIRIKDDGNIVTKKEVLRIELIEEEEKVFTFNGGSGSKPEIDDDNEKIDEGRAYDLEHE